MGHFNEYLPVTPFLVAFVMGLYWSIKWFRNRNTVRTGARAARAAEKELKKQVRRRERHEKVITLIYQELLLLIKAENLSVDSAEIVPGHWGDGEIRIQKGDAKIWVILSLEEDFRHQVLLSVAKDGKEKNRYFYTNEVGNIRNMVRYHLR